MKSIFKMLLASVVVFGIAGCSSGTVDEGDPPDIPDINIEIPDDPMKSGESDKGETEKK